jgi:hypothetical protein
MWIAYKEKKKEETEGVRKGNGAEKEKKKKKNGPGAWNWASDSPTGTVGQPGKEVEADDEVADQVKGSRRVY